MTPEQQAEMLEAAYQLLNEFQLVIDELLDGHHSSRAVDRWLTLYEKMPK